MSRRNYIHTMDALIYGYSNFTFTPPTGITTTAVRSEVANAPMAFDETANRFTPTPEPVLITPTMETVRPESTPSPYIVLEDDVRPPAPTPFVPIIDIINPSPVYVRPESTPTFMPTSEDNVNRTILDSKPYHKPTESSISPTFIAEEDERKPVAPSPIVNIINPSPYVAPPLIVGGGGAMGGGGGAMGEGRKPLFGAVATKPSFIKKNFIPILLIASAIYVFIKKPIK